MPRIVNFLDRLVDAGIVAVLIFTALAFGAVEEWARAIGQILIWLVFAAWIVKLIWMPPPPRNRVRPGTLLGGRLRLTGVELPALMFVGVLLLQLVPLPPNLIRTLSPRAAEIYATTLPGYPVGQGTFATLPRWLHADPGASAGDVPVLPADPDVLERAFPAEWFDVEYSSWRTLSLSPHDTRRALAVVLAHLVLFVVAFHQFGPRRGASRLAWAPAVLAGVLAVVGILQHLTAEGLIYWFRRGSSHFGFGPFVNANHFAGWMELALPLAAALALTYGLGRPGRRRDNPSPPLALLFGFISVVGLAAFLLAQSRGGTLALSAALVVATIVFLARGRLRWKPAIAALIPLALTAALVIWIDYPAVSERYGTLADVQKERSFKTRLDFSRQSIEIARDFPLIGSGLGSFQKTYQLYTPGTSNQVLVHAHNDYAEVAAETGVLGSAAVAWALVLLVSRGVFGGLMRRPHVSSWTVRAAAIGVLALLLHSFVDFNLQVYSNSLLFVFLCALLMRDAADDREAAGVEA